MQMWLVPTTATAVVVVIRERASASLAIRATSARKALA